MKESESPVWRQAQEKADKAKQYEEAKNGYVKPRCPACGQPVNILWVHGQGQCTHCKMNVMHCCDGETCE